MIDLLHSFERDCYFCDYDHFFLISESLLWIIDLYRYKMNNLSDENRFILLVSSSIILVRLITDGCHFIDSKIRNVPMSRSILS